MLEPYFQTYQRQETNFKYVGRERVRETKIVDYKPIDDFNKVLDSSAGTGALLRAVRESRLKSNIYRGTPDQKQMFEFKPTELDACEIDEQARILLRQTWFPPKSYYDNFFDNPLYTLYFNSRNEQVFNDEVPNIVCFDAFEWHGIYDLVIINPPWSTWKKHLIHAWNNNVRKGGHLCVLVNGETFERIWNLSEQGVDLGPQDKEVVRLVKQFSFKQWENFGPVFDSPDAERKTKVPAVCIWLKYPGFGEDSEQSPKSDFGHEFKGVNFEKLHNEQADFSINIPDNLFSHNNNQIAWDDPIDEMVGKYHELMSVFDSFDKVQNQMYKTLKNLDMGLTEFKKQDISKAKSSIRIKMWEQLFKEGNLTTYMTSNYRKMILGRLDQYKKVGFNRVNIETIVREFIGERDIAFQSCVEEMFDHITSKADNKWIDETDPNFKEERWKTNDPFMMKYKTIWPYVVSYNGVNFSISADNQYQKDDRIRDLDIVMCLIAEMPINGIRTLKGAVTHAIKETNAGNVNSGKWWNNCEYGRFKFYKKGTFHLEINDQWKDVWDRFNVKAVQGKGWLK